jgi:hypothetical protein
MGLAVFASPCQPLFGNVHVVALVSNSRFEQALRVDRLPSAPGFAASNFLPATQGQR